MKILVISHMYPSSFNPIEGIFVHQQVKELQKQECEIKVISPVPWSPFPIKNLTKKWKRYSEIPKKATWDGIEVYYPRYLEFPRALFFASSGRRMYFGIKKTVSEIYKNFKFDIIHSHVALPDGYAGMLLAKEYQKPLIVTIHGQDFQQTIYRNNKCRKKIEEVINFSAKTIVVSNKLKKIGEKNPNISHQKLITIPNGINLEDIYQGKSNLIEKYKNKKIILSVSNLIEIKGIDLNIRAVAELIKKYPNIIYLIIGEGVGRKNLENLVKELNLVNYVKFLGQLPRDKVMEYMSICDVFSLPSWNEGFGVVYIEAMVQKKPVIGCLDQGIEDVIKNKENGLLIELKSVDGLVKAIDSLLSDSQKIKKISENAQKTVLENYTWEKIAKQIINLY